jgi:hypothetical protein
LSARVSKAKKDECWEKITARVNSVGCGVKQTTLEVQKKFKNMRQKARELAAAEKKSAQRTGGGSPDYEIDEDPLLQEMRSHPAAVGINGGGVEAAAGLLSPSAVSPNVSVLQKLCSSITKIKKSGRKKVSGNEQASTRSIETAQLQVLRIQKQNLLLARRILYNKLRRQRTKKCWQMQAHKLMR